MQFLVASQRAPVAQHSLNQFMFVRLWRNDHLFRSEILE